jgi:Holliday junction resolvase
MPKKKKKRISSRSKGARGERELAAELRRIFGTEAYRGRQFHGREDAPDVVSGIPGTHWECKRTEGLSVYAALEQAEWDKGEGDVPVVAHRRNGKKRWVVCLYLEDLLRLVETLGGLKGEESCD